MFNALYVITAINICSLTYQFTQKTSHRVVVLVWAINTEMEWRTSTLIYTLYRELLSKHIYGKVLKYQYSTVHLAFYNIQSVVMVLTHDHLLRKAAISKCESVDTLVGIRTSCHEIESDLLNHMCRCVLYLPLTILNLISS